MGTDPIRDIRHDHAERRCGDGEYRDLLQSRLPQFLDSLSESKPIRLAIYNAGTDVVQDDPLGGLALTPNGVLERDRFVIAQLRQREIPSVMLLSGGYTRDSYQLVANSISEMLETYD